MNKIYKLAEEFLQQKNIAVAGVTRDKDGAANLIFKKLQDTGHTVYPVNPNTETFKDVKCYPDVKSIPFKVDGVVIVTKPDVSAKIVEDCIESGIKRVWMHNSFGNRNYDKPNSSLSSTAMQMCKDKDITVIPGGCPLMFGAKADGGHKFLRAVTRCTGGFRL